VGGIVWKVDSWQLFYGTYQELSVCTFGMASVEAKVTLLLTATASTTPFQHLPVHQATELYTTLAAAGVHKA
jgi:hypothetical protein